MAVALALLAPLAGPSMPVAHAAAITVNSPAGTKVTDGACTLREAIENANKDAATWPDCAAGSGADIIVLPAGATITLTAVDNGASIIDVNGLPIITSNITINGNGAIIERWNTIWVYAFRIFEVAPDGTLTLNNVTVRNGLTPDGSGMPGVPGGGIANLGALTITNSTISNNRTGDGDGDNNGGWGGGIYNSGTLTITNSTVSNNRTGDGDGGGPGGGIYNSGTLNVNNSTISGNTTGNGSGTGGGGDGGGILNSGTLTIANSTISGNQTGDGDWGGYGGGIYSAGTLTITNSTISGNTTGNGTNRGGTGGGIDINATTLTIKNSTISGNTTGSGPSGGGHGGGIHIESGGSGTMDMTSCTVASNHAGGAGGGISNGSTATLKNAIVANNTAAFSGPNCDGTITNGGNNLDSGTSCGWGSTNGSLSNTNPLLAPLADYGGSTQTMALLPGSPAIDGGVCIAGITGDQRGVTRPQGAACDIGAYESEWVGWQVYLPLVLRNY